MGLHTTSADGAQRLPTDGAGMFQLTINEKGGATRQESFEKNEVTIGRVQGNDVILPKGNISKRHSRIVLKDGKFIIVDLKSTNGTYVNGKKITAPQVVKASDKIYIGDFTIQIQPNGAAEPRPGRSAPDEIDLFGGDAAPMDPEPARGGGAPGLIDDNFDQEFEARAPEAHLSPPEPEPDVAPEPVAPEPEPAPELDLGGEGLNLEDGFGGGLDPVPEVPEDALAEAEAPPLDAAGFLDGPDAAQPQPELEAAPPDLEPLAPEPEPEPEPEAEPEPKAPVRPSGRRAAPRSAPSRVRPIPTRPRGEAPAEEGARSATVPPPTGSQPEAMPVPAAWPPAMSSAEPLTPSEAERLIHAWVVEDLGLRGLPLKDLPTRRADASLTARAHAERLQRIGLLTPQEPVGRLADRCAQLATNLSALSELLVDETVVELTVTHDRQVLVDRDGQLEEARVDIPSEDKLVDLIRQLGVLGGVNPGEDEPLVDVRLRDGSRLVAALPPVAFRGPTFTLRKTTRDDFTLDKLLEYSTISEAMLAFVDTCVRYRKNVVLAVGPGVTPTATLNALLAQVPMEERTVTIENGVELHVEPERLVTTLQPTDELRLERLVDFAVQMQSERLVAGDLGELDPDALASVLGATAGPLRGSFMAVGAASPEEAVRRIRRALAETPDGEGLLAQNAPVILQEERFLDNSRRITRISEVVADGDDVHLQDIFMFHPRGLDENQIVIGSFSATGAVPRFLEDLEARNEAPLDKSIFDPT